MITDKKQLLEILISISWQAAEKILEFYRSDRSITLKEDGSPLTKADLASNEIILDGLKKLTPDIPIVSEESIEVFQHDHNNNTFWLVDPLDGTKEFINKNGEFTTNIALIQNNIPTMGVICAPALHTLYAGIVKEGAFKEKQNERRTPILTSSPNEEGYIVVGSRSHGNKEEILSYLEGKKLRKVLPVGSSLKFCKIAEGEAHLYPRLGRTMEWDTAAGHAILLSVGGQIKTLTNRELLYNKNNFENPYFVAMYS